VSQISNARIKKIFNYLISKLLFSKKQKLIFIISSMVSIFGYSVQYYYKEMKRVIPMIENESHRRTLKF